MPIPDAVLKAHTEVVKLTKEAITNADEGSLADLAGTTRGTEKQLANLRKLAVSELPDKVEGEEWRIERGRVAKRSFNTPGLLAKFAEKLDGSMLKTIGYLLGKGVIKIEWQWTKLKDEARAFEVPLLEVARTIEADDEADVGAVWVDGYPRYEAISDE